jgi:hypothetical protein
MHSRTACARLDPVIHVQAQALLQYPVVPAQQANNS